MKSIADCRLYAFVDTAYLAGRPVALVTKQLCDGGADLIQLRAKQSSLDEIRAMASEIRDITQSANVGFVVNDHLDIAQEVGADFCHLGQEDFFAAGRTNASQLTTLANPPSTIHYQLLIGLSSHAPEQAKRAVAAGADYVAIGPVYATATKPGAKPVTLEYVRWAAANLTLPWFAIGGINLQTLGEVLAAGARRVCVVSAILNAPDVQAACAKFKRQLETH